MITSELVKLHGLVADLLAAHAQATKDPRDKDSDGVELAELIDGSQHITVRKWNGDKQGQWHVIVEIMPNPEANITSEEPYIVVAAEYPLDQDRETPNDYFCVRVGVISACLSLIKPLLCERKQYAGVKHIRAAWGDLQKTAGKKADRKSSLPTTRLVDPSAIPPKLLPGSEEFDTGIGM